MRLVDLRKPPRRRAIGAVAVLAGLAAWATRDLSGRSDSWPAARTIPGWGIPHFFGRDGRTLRLWRMNDHFYEVDLATGAERDLPRVDRRRPGPTSPDGRFVVDSRFDGTWCVQDAATGVEVGRHKLDDDRAWYAPTFAADGRSLVFFLGIRDHAEEVRVWDFTTGAVTRRPLSRPPGLSRFRASGEPPGWVVSPDGRLLAYFDALGGGVLLWDAASDRPAGPPLRTPTTRNYHTDDPVVAFTPDGRSLLHGQHDGRVEVWDVAARALVRTLAVGSPDDFINHVAISEDGRRLVVHHVPWIKDPLRRGVRSARDAVLPTSARPEDDTTVLLDFASGRRLAHAAGGHDLALSPDGRSVAIGHRDRITIHHAPTAQSP